MPRRLLLLAVCFFTACSFDPVADPSFTDKRDAGPDIVEVARDGGPKPTARDGGTDAGRRDGGPTPPRDGGPPADSGVPFVPSNGIPPEVFVESDAMFTINARYHFNTDTGAIYDQSDAVVRPSGTGVDPNVGVGFRVIAQTGAPGIGVFSFDTLTIGENGTLRAFGSNGLAIVAGGDIDIAGFVDLRGGPTACGPFRQAAPTCAGPGGQIGGDYCAPCCSDCTSSTFSCDECSTPCTCLCGANRPGDAAPGSTGFGICHSASGGGGGGHGLAGASGGDGSTFGVVVNAGVITTGGEPGAPFGLDGLEPLTGGGGGGAGATVLQSPMPGLGGGGGGALQLVSGTSVRLASNSACGINVGGGGGGRSQSLEGGGGGGAGGGVLIEAVDVTVRTECFVVANGGGGSGGHGGAAGPAGQNGLAPASGSGAQTCRGGRGGDGAARNQPLAEDAPDGPFNCGGIFNYANGSGGGGGGIGIIRVNTDTMTVDGPTSPSPTFGIPTRN